MSESEKLVTGGGVLFALGTVVATPGALLLMEKYAVQPGQFLHKHQHGDWGCLSADDKHENTVSVAHGLRILSSYRLGEADRIWVITEADRSVTTLLLPEEY